MAKRETKQTYKQTQLDRTRVDQEIKDLQQQARERAYNQEQATTGMGTELGSVYRDLYGGSGAYTPGAALGVAGTANWNNISTGNLNDVRQKWAEFGKTGGFSDERKASIMENVAGLKEIGRTGGLTDENIARMRGLGGFEEYAKTGGYTDDDLARIELAAITPIGAYATGTQEELDRRRALQGGYAPGFDAASRQMRRDTARNIADTSLAAKIQLKDRVNEGRRWGIGGLSAAEAEMTRQLVGNKLAGLTGAGNMELTMQNMISQYMAMGMSGEQATAQAIADIDRANSIGQLGADTFNIQNAQNINAANLADRQFAAEDLWRRQAAGLSGLQGLYNTGVGLTESERDRVQNLQGTGMQYSLGLYGPQTQLAMQPGAGTNIMKGIGTAAGLAAMAFGGPAGIAAGGSLAGASQGIGTTGVAPSGMSPYQNIFQPTQSYRPEIYTPIVSPTPINRGGYYGGFQNYNGMGNLQPVYF